MKTIFSRTLETTIKKISIILFVLAGVACGYLLASASRSRVVGSSYDSLLDFCTMIQHLMVFFGLCGVILFANVIENGTGLIANEVHEGTFKLLAAKPNTRVQILFGKLAGTFLGCFILMMVGLGSYYAALGIFRGFDGNIYNDLFSYLPCYILYGVVTIAIMLSISILLSCIVKRKVAAMLPLLALAIVIFGVFPFYRLVNSLTTGTSNTMNLVDLNYHFAIIFKQCVNLKAEINSSTAFVYLTNLFTFKQLDKDVVRMSFAPSIICENTSVQPMIVNVAYLIIVAACYISSFFIIKKKDI